MFGAQVENLGRETMGCGGAEVDAGFPRLYDTSKYKTARSRLGGTVRVYPFPRCRRRDQLNVWPEL